MPNPGKPHVSIEGDDN
jgi:phosphopantetheinyl transferase (holo-ACP synthase)